MNKTVSYGKRTGVVCVPSSKSVAHRLLICAALGTEPVVLRLNGISKDITATANCLCRLGAELNITEHEIAVLPIRKSCSGQESAHSMVELPVGESGSTLRFLLPLVGALGRETCFHMEGRLPDRPLSPLDELLRQHGMDIRQEKTDLYTSGRLSHGSYVLPGNVSSQFFSGLLMSLPFLSGSSYLQAEGTLQSAGYLDLTEEALEKADVLLRHPKKNCWEIPGNQQVHLPSQMDVEGDWSNAAFFLCMAALSEPGIVVCGLKTDSRQGDRDILKILSEFGASVSIEQNRMTVKKKNVRPFMVDAAPIPDLIPVLSVLACAAEGDTWIRNAARLRLKESDRLRSTAQMIRDLGGCVDELADGLIIHGCGKLRGGIVDPCNDHRIAMSSAVAATLCSEPVTVLNAECVEKSYPNFWIDLDTLEKLV